MAVKIRYMLDGNVIDLIVDGHIKFPADQKIKLVGTLVQRAELERIPDLARRKELLCCFDTLVDEIAVTETFVWGESVWGNAKWGSGAKFENFRARLTERDKKSKSQIPNQTRDTPFAETAIANGHTLLTTDRILAEVTHEFGGTVIWVDKNNPSTREEFRKS